MTHSIQPHTPNQTQPQAQNADLLPSADDIDAANEGAIHNPPASAITKKQLYIFALILAALAAGGAAAYHLSRPQIQPLSIDELVDQSMKRQF